METVARDIAIVQDYFKNSAQPDGTGAYLKDPKRTAALDALSNLKAIGALNVAEVLINGTGDDDFYGDACKVLGISRKTYSE